MTAPADQDADQTAAEWDAAMNGEGEGGNAEDDLAADWESMVDGEGATIDPPNAAVDDGRESSRVLNQDEIDSLLGFDEDKGEGDESAGIQAILNSALVSYERLPMLEVVMTDSVVATRPLKPGDVMRTVFETLGEARINVV